MLQPEEVTKNGGSGGSCRRKEAEECGEVPCHAPATPRQLLQFAGTRMTNSSVEATGLEQPPPGKGSRVEAPPRAADTTMLMGAPGSRALHSSLSLSFSHLSSGESGDVGATFQGDSRAGGRDPRWLLVVTWRTGEGAQGAPTHAAGLLRLAAVTPAAMPKLNKLQPAWCHRAWLHGSRAWFLPLQLPDQPQPGRRKLRLQSDDTLV